jgi:hypothetical protein
MQYKTVNIVLLSIFWALLIGAILWSLHCSEKYVRDVHEQRSQLPCVVNVRALTNDMVSNSVTVIDGVVINVGDSILMWSPEKYRKGIIFTYTRKGWEETNRVEDLIPGSTICIRDGFRYAARSLRKTSKGLLTPTWNADLLSDHNVWSDRELYLMCDENERICVNTKFIL